MANHTSAKKRIRQTARRKDINGARRNSIRTFIKKVENAIIAGDKTAAEGALKLAEPQMMRGAQKGVFLKNTMSRKLSRLSASVKGLAA
ncbi:MAG: 30S ribosomal protein S20 [Magnetovibrio sp.]|nr:30S ribosomal protein S20 [Magnetovibrio sp.]